MATSVPVPMAMPRSAAASAGASLMPSPTIATTWPCVLQRARPWRPSRRAAPRRARGRCRPRAAMACAVAALSPVSIHTSSAERLQLGDRLGGLGLDGVGDRRAARPAAPSTATNIGVCPAAAAAAARRSSAAMSTPRLVISAALPTSTLPAVDGGVDAVTGDGVEGSQRRQRRGRASRGGGDDRLADRVLAAGLGGGDQGQQLVVGPAAERWRCR